MKQYLLALDEGTTSARAILFDPELRVRAVAQHEFEQIYPRPGWVEQDPLELFAAQAAAMTECVAKSGVKPEEIAGIGVTNQRETTVIWERATGKPVCNAIVWQCRRTAPLCDQWKKNGWEEKIREKTGLKIDAYFSATKIVWILENVPGAREKALRGELCFGTVDTYLLWKLSGGALHLTDRTNASRTMLYNLHTDSWDDELLSLFGIPSSMLPEIRSSSEIYGEIDLLGAKVPVCGIAGDQQAALFGQGCFEKGMAKNTYGTGCFLLSHTGNAPVMSKNGLLTTLCASEKGNPREFALEGSVFVGGAVLQWLRDEMKLIDSSPESDRIAEKTPSTDGVYVVPAFVGLGAPYWDMNVRGAVFGLTRGSGRAQIVRAALESIAYQTHELLKAMEADSGAPITSLKVDGGVSRSRFLMQFQSSLSETEVVKPVSPEATALGAAALAGLAAGVFENRADFAEKLAVSERFVPEMPAEERKKLLDGWRRAVRACREFQV